MSYHWNAFVALFRPVLTGAQLTNQVAERRGITKQETESLILGHTSQDPILVPNISILYTTTEKTQNQL